MTDASLTPEAVIARYERARQRRRAWEGVWRDCYDYALPRRDGALAGQSAGAAAESRLFDGTAPDAVEQLAASLVAELTPPWSRWLDFQARTADGPPPEELQDLAAGLQGHFDRSNFQTEIHQCFLDLAVAGTACLLFEEAAVGEDSAFRFTAVPLGEVVVEEGPSGRPDATFRRSRVTPAQAAARFPQAESALYGGDAADDASREILEAVVPDSMNRYRYLAVLAGDGGDAEGPLVLARGMFAHSPFINFRWLKAPGETYGRSPVMKVLADIKTANKVVELMLKNASIAVTGIWQADDDGVLNPAAIRLTPGSIIPKAVGSQGLQPLKPANDFALSEALLQDLRQRIRHGLLADQLTLAGAPQMTATEVLERTSAMTRLLGAAYGRIQAELMQPLARRALAILHRRGEAPEMILDTAMVATEFQSPLTRRQRMERAAPLLQWFSLASAAGPEALQGLDMPAAARWLAESFSVPRGLLRTPPAAISPQADKEAQQ